jgi:hypothetical protein
MTELSPATASGVPPMVSCGMRAMPTKEVPAWEGLIMAAVANRRPSIIKEPI